ncbi:MAG: ABC transporter ATP-binding protein [Flavobacteriales bacterium]|nr:ABC transporter ATP-binding protein [Flavobacteriales bacterium]
MIELKNISKSFGDHKVIDNISINYERGKTNLIIGASGSGKSVLTKCTVGLIEPDSGSVIYDGQDFTAMSLDERKEVRKEIGMLFQGGALFDSMTVAENVKFPLQMHSKMSNEEMDDRVNECLKRVNLINAEDKYPGEISGGMQKRVGIARAISLNPKYLFCDEPNSGLDPATAVLIDNLIQEITYENQITTIVITHDMNSVLEIGDKVLFIYKGKNEWEGTKDNIYSTTSKELADLVFASDLMKQLRKVHTK